MQKDRRALMNNLFENMTAVKRGMAGRLQLINRDCPIPRSQLELLFTIHHSQPISFKQLAQQLYMTPGAVSQLAEGLEQHELITRHADEHDRRIQCLRVSPKGTELLHGIEKRLQTFMETVMQDLTDEELGAWLKVQEKMLQHLQDPNNQSKKESI